MGSSKLIYYSFQSLSILKIDFNILMLLAVIGSIILAEWLEASTIVTLYILSDTLKSSCKSLAQQRLKTGMTKMPRLVKLKDGRSLPLDEVEVSSTIVTCAGDVVCIDGIVCAGSGVVDESSVTGEY